MRKLLSCLLLLPLLLWARVDVDYATFRYEPGQVDVEIFYTIPRTLLSYTAAAAGSTATALLKCKLSKDHAVWKELTWKIQDVIPEATPEKKNSQIVDRLKVLAPPGQYDLVLYIQDAAIPAAVDSTTLTVQVPEYGSEQLAMSDIELAAAIDKNALDGNDPFFKNSLRVVPNPTRVFGKEQGPLNFYVETYNLLNNLPGETFIIRYAVSSADGKLLLRKAAARKKKVDAGVEFFTVPVDTLATGAYLLKFSLADTSGQEKIAKQTRFFIVNKHIAVKSGQDETSVISIALHSELGVLDEATLDKEFRQALYLSNSEERQTYKTLANVEAKRNFIHLFWQKKSTANDPRKFREEYLQRVKQANRDYTVMNKEGWQTDRGRVYIQYGPPSYVQHYPTSEGNRPYEEWEYNEIQGGSIFIFADFSGNRDYQLLHSNVIGENSDLDYMSRIKAGH
jgi:GWxTD domain-containing protein